MKHLLTVSLLSIATIAFGQYDEFLGKDVPLKDRIYVGGGFGLGFNSYADYVAVSPNVGVRITKRGSFGIGVQYQYRNYKTFKVKTNDWGGSVFTQYKLFGPFFLHAEYEYVNYEFVDISLATYRKGYSSILVGGGIAQPITQNVSFIISALYNLSYSDTDPGPYNTPWNLRVGISAGF